MGGSLAHKLRELTFQDYMSDLQIFNFNSNTVRIQTIEGKEYFCAKDVCDTLGYVNGKDAISRHCKKDGVVKYALIDSLNRDRFANVSYSTRGLERGMETATAIASNLISRRSDQGGRGVYGGGRDLQKVQDFMQRAAVTFDDKATNLALNKAMAAQRADEKMADVQLKNLIGLQNELQANRNLQSAYLGSGIQGLTSALAGLQSVDPDFGDPEELIEDIVEDNNTQNSFGSGGGGGGYTQLGGLS